MVVFPPFFFNKVEAVYLALAAEAAGTGGGDGDRPSPPLPPKLAGKKRLRAGGDGGSFSGEDGAAGGGVDGTSDVRESPAATATATAGAGAKGRSLLHATISRYFDEGGDASAITAAPDTGSNAGGEGGGPDGADSGGDGRGPPGAAAGVSPVAVAGEAAEVSSRASAAAAAAAEAAAKVREEALPHQPLDKRACEVLVRDASVLVTDPSFQGRLNAGFDDGYGGAGSGGGGLGFFDAATGGTAAAGGGGGGTPRIGMAPHSWLLKVSGRVVFGANGSFWRGRRGGQGCASARGFPWVGVTRGCAIEWPGVRDVCVASRNQPFSFLSRI